MPPRSEFSRAGLGIALYLGGVFFFAVNDAIAKWLVADYSVAQLLLVRSIAGLAILLPAAWSVGVSLRTSGSPLLHLTRVALQTADTYGFYFASRNLPLADVMTFYMAAPIILTAISALFLRERVGIYRWSAVLVGFVGVIIALAPTGAAFQPGALIALAGSCAFALSLAITRQLRDNHPLALVSWQFIASAIVGGVLSPLAWVTPGWLDLGLMLLLGIIASSCFWAITRALALAPASLIAPFQYSAILWAAMFGWIVWHDAPTPRIILGNAILVASGLFVFYRERRLAISVSDKVEQIP
jgi:S-adenosylmethionine uptake transporter